MLVFYFIYLLLKLKSSSDKRERTSVIHLTEGDDLPKGG